MISYTIKRELKNDSFVTYDGTYMPNDGGKAKTFRISLDAGLDEVMIDIYLTQLLNRLDNG
jgi:hypothetical protein